MKAKIELTEADIRQAVGNYIEQRLGMTINQSQIILWVKSSQNFRSEWEVASFKGEFEADPKGVR